LTTLAAQNFSKDLLYSPKFCEEVINYRATGKSLAHWCGFNGISMKRVRSWEKLYPHFAEALEIAELVAMGKWEDHLEGQATGEIEKGSSSAATYYMNNNFASNYKNKQEIEHKGGNIIMVDTGIDDGEVIEEVEFTEINKPHDGDLL